MKAICKGMAVILVAGVSLAAVAAVPDFEPPQNRAVSLRIAHLGYLANTAPAAQALAYAQRLPRSITSDRDAIRAQIQLSHQMVGYGLLQQATTRYRRYLINPSTYLGASYSNAQRNALWLDLANAWHQHGNNQQAQAAIKRTYGLLPQALAGQRLSLMARIYISGGHSDRAIEALRKWQNRHQVEALAPLARYNMGIALLRSGHREEGAGVLNSVGTDKATGNAALALRDMANLTLGFAYLEAKQGATARALFQRIRLNGPFTDTALLGLGWADIAPDGQPQTWASAHIIHCADFSLSNLLHSYPLLRRLPSRGCGPPKRMDTTGKFDTVEGPETQKGRYEQALVPWLKLVKNGDQAGSATLEALVAIPYVYATLGAKRQASQAYTRALSHLVTADQQSKQIIGQLQADTTASPYATPAAEATFTWLKQRWNLPDSPAVNGQLRDMMNRARFHQAARNLRDLLALHGQLQANSQQLAGLASHAPHFSSALTDKQNTLLQQASALQKRTTTAIKQLDTYLRDVTLTATNRYQNKLEIFISHARAGRALLFEAINSSPQ